MPDSPDTAQFLVPGTPMDLSRAIRYNRDVYPAWGQLPRFAKEGTPGDPPAGPCPGHTEHS